MAAAAAAEKDAALEVVVLVVGRTVGRRLLLLATRPVHLPRTRRIALRVHDDADMVGKRCVCGLCGVWVE